jgi:peptide/nickel transport system permease protein
MTTQAASLQLEVAPQPIERSRFRPARIVGMIPLVILAVFVLTALLADWIAPYSPYRTSLTTRLTPPFWQETGSFEHILGTDRLGRDILSRIIFGARYSLVTGLAAVLLGGLVGTTLGLIAGYYGRIVDALIMRTTDAMLSMPIILIALLFAVSFGPAFENLIIVLALVMWARFSRLVRGEVLTWKERDFVALARVAGCSDLRIMFVHILPNVVNALVVLATLQVGWALIVEASLSFLGAGIPPPTPSWGAMIADGGTNIMSAWWLSVFPGAALMLVLLSLNLLGDGLRDALDPKMAER